VTPSAPLPASPARLHSAASAAFMPTPPPDWSGPVTGAMGGGGAAATAAAVALDARPATLDQVPVVKSTPRPRRETARVVVRSGGAWRGLVVVLAALLLVGAGVVHFKVAPLDVVVVWRKPATLTIASEPAGATVKLDGADLVGVTPLQTTVKRDRAEHVLELSAPGHRPARQVVRYDGAVVLASTVHLEKEEAQPSFEPLPQGAGSPQPAASAEAAAPGRRSRPPRRKPLRPPRQRPPRPPRPRRQRSAAKAAKGGKAAKAGKLAARTPRASVSERWLDEAVTEAADTRRASVAPRARAVTAARVRQGRHRSASVGG
jgi:hypothetical protein